MTAFIFSADGGVGARLHPDEDLLVEMARPAALHLYHLLVRYNRACPDRKRWDRYWPKITGLERTVLVRFVQANCDGVFGVPLHIRNMPEDFQALEGRRRAMSLSGDIEAEFRAFAELADGAAAVAVREYELRGMRTVH